ncbi:MAG: YbjN domain-containing protein [Oscillospiraceae bacterium]|nr:YbjN domain-containing protein [Oscillospiraceae bacterium]
MKLFQQVMTACAERFGRAQVMQLADNQLEIAMVNDAGEPMFPVYMGFHNANDIEFTAILFEVPEADQKAFMAQCNTMNTQYPMVRFYMDSGYLCAGLDLLLYTEDAADVMSMLTALLQVIAANLPALLG